MGSAVGIFDGCGMFIVIVAFMFGSICAVALIADLIERFRSQGKNHADRKRKD